ncbi:MAG: repressor LexA [Lentisphaerae bacterium]|nr:repressor LexA [Lentisphaerota bacterium]
MRRDMMLNERAAILRRFFRTERRMPTYSEMIEMFGYRSKNAVFGLLLRLEEKGIIVKKHGKIAMTDTAAGPLRLLGSVQAGFPSPAEEELLGTVSLDEMLIEHPDRTFMLKVTGDSMVDAGIHPGDMVLVEKGVAPKPNDIVIANVDGEWTMKFFMRDRSGIRLEPANGKYRPIRPRNSLEIGGVVRGVVRKYQ